MSANKLFLEVQFTIIRMPTDSSHLQLEIEALLLQFPFHLWARFDVLVASPSQALVNYLQVLFANALRCLVPVLVRLLVVVLVALDECLREKIEVVAEHVRVLVERDHNFELAVTRSEFSESGR